MVSIHFSFPTHCTSLLGIFVDPDPMCSMMWHLLAGAQGKCHAEVPKNSQNCGKKFYICFLYRVANKMTDLRKKNL